MFLPDFMNAHQEWLNTRWNCRKIDISVLSPTILASVHLVISGIPLLLFPCEGLKSHTNTWNLSKLIPLRELEDYREYGPNESNREFVWGKLF